MTAPLRKAAALLGGVVLALLLLEAGLQVVAFVVYLREKREAPPPAAPGERVILCVGDSFTWGVGASSRSNSYPSRLARELERSGAGAPRVVSEGWPGRDSRELLEQLDVHLRRLSPTLVYVLVGMNDAWRRPDPLPPVARSAAPSGFPLRWRTQRLLALLRPRLFGPRRSPAPRAGSDAAAPEPSTPRRPTGLAEALRSRTRGEAWRRIERHEYDEASAVLERLVQSDPEDLPSREALVSSLSRSSRLPEAQAHVEWLATRYERTGDRPAGESWLAGLSALGRTQDCVREGKAFVERYPASARGWRILATEAHLALALEVAEPAYGKAIELAATSGEAAYLHRTRGRMRLDRDPKAALHDYVRAFLLDGDDRQGGASFRAGGPPFTEDLLAACLQDLHASEEDAARVGALFREARRPSDAYLLVYEGHLREIVRRCKEAGAGPVLLTYPAPNPALEAVLRRVAEETGAGHLDLALRFAQHLRSRTASELFIPDGHCTDAGYELVAQAVSEDVLLRLPR